MHTGKAIKKWRKTNNLTAHRLSQILPEPLTDGQMIYRWEATPHWIGSAANGHWLVQQGAITPAQLLRDNTAA